MPGKGDCMTNADLPSFNWYSRQEALMWEDLRRRSEAFFSMTHDLMFKSQSMDTEKQQKQDELKLPPYEGGPLHNPGQLKQQPLTRGQQVMSVSFNPGQREDVAAIKQIFADAFDEIDKWVAARLTTGELINTQVADMGRLAAIAKTNLETAQMYAVKAVTR